MMKDEIKLRVNISKKLRFEVFKRDGFTCQYCGNHPPEIILEIDHINPISEGGTNDINNLITSCFSCNRGKGKIELRQVTNTMVENMEIIKEMELQYIEYHELITRINKRIESEIESVSEIFSMAFPRYALSEKFKNDTIKKFIEKLGVYDVKDAMQTTCDKFSSIKRTMQYNIYNVIEDAPKYICGICWNKIKNKENGKEIH